MSDFFSCMEFKFRILEVYVLNVYTICNAIATYIIYVFDKSALLTYVTYS